MPYIKKLVCVEKQNNKTTLSYLIVHSLLRIYIHFMAKSAVPGFK